MPENFTQNATPPKGAILGSSIFTQRRNDIFKRLQVTSEQCKLKYSERKELASEKDDTVAELCEALDDAFNYGLRHQSNFVVTAASLFQNMHEIVTGNSTHSNAGNEESFWDFCQIHLTLHERQRFENLNHVWTKAGLGKAFVRAALNEGSLHRYLLTFLSDRELLGRYYTHWSLLLEEEVSKEVVKFLDGFDKILFALTVDVIELNKTIRTIPNQPVVKEEPIIYAPTPMPSSKSKRSAMNAIERPIATSNSLEDLVKNLGLEINIDNNVTSETNGIAEDVAEIIIPQNNENVAFDPIEPELEFLKQPLPDIYPETQTTLRSINDSVKVPSVQDFEDKSDSSSQYSKTSSTNDSANCVVLEEKLREMNEHCALLETRVAQLSLENRQLVRRLTRHFNESGIDPNSSFATNFLITIPTVNLINPRRATSASYYVYEIHITMRIRLEHWSVMRRYRDFYKLHKTLLRTHPSVVNVDFPPKKHFGNKNLVFVEERRQQLQIYLLNLVESLPQIEACKTKVELQRVFPFLKER